MLFKFCRNTISRDSKVKISLKIMRLKYLEHPALTGGPSSHLFRVLATGRCVDISGKSLRLAQTYKSTDAAAIASGKKMGRSQSTVIAMFLFNNSHT